MADERPLQVEMCIVGTEIVMGRIQDTNSSWMAQRVAGLGAFIRRITQVQDHEDDICDVLQGALRRHPDVLIVCGGMGPTADDVTVACVANVLDASLIQDEETVTRFMQRRNVADRSQLSPGAMKMATVPQGATIGQNSAGWAPALQLKYNSTDIFVLPGPPKEMEATFVEHVFPVLAKRVKRRTYSVRLAVDMHESEVAPLMRAVQQNQPGTYLKAYVALWMKDIGFLPVDIIATGADETQAQEAAQRALATFTGMVQEQGKHWRTIEDNM